MNRRLDAMDALRGLIMAVMALDHASFFVARVHPFEFWSAPLPDYGGSAAWFFTRWLTHICAPGFFFLMGAGMALFADSRREMGWSESAIARRLAIRGLLLIPVSYLLEAPAWLLPSLTGASTEAPFPGGSYVMLGVLETLGLAMAFCALLMRLSARSWLAIAFIAIMAPNFLIPTLRGRDEGVGYLMRIFVVPGETPPVMTAYPLLPWLGVCALGIGFGRLVVRNRERALNAMLPMGLAYLLAFAGLRLGGGFGNLRIAAAHTWISWLTVVKYPPSLAFSSLTLGLNLILLSIFARVRVPRFLTVYGRAPLLFYVAHLYVFALMRIVLFRAAAPPQPVLYVAWLAGVALLYPACKWYDGFKHSRPPESLWRAF